MNIRVHLTNVTGIGAVKLIQSLLPALEKSIDIDILYLPDRGPLRDYIPHGKISTLKYYKRIIPNGFSRAMECLFSMRLNGATPLMVFGDIPLRCKAPQIVFVQNSHLIRPSNFSWSISGLRLAIFRLIFRLNINFAQVFIVQTEVMLEGLTSSYPSIAGKIRVISQPPPSWILDSVVNLENHNRMTGKKLRLIYPAAGYPHKNHKLLEKIFSRSDLDWPIENLKLTISPDNHPNQNLLWIECSGLLSEAQIIEAYSKVDALLFLSTHESYGIPLIEAMFLGLPIVCPNLPYARALCLCEAIYFEPNSVDSLNQAILTLHSRLTSGWRPNWRLALTKIPKSWELVAGEMVGVIRGA